MVCVYHSSIFQDQLAEAHIQNLLRGNEAALEIAKISNDLRFPKVYVLGAVAVADVPRVDGIELGQVASCMFLDADAQGPFQMVSAHLDICQGDHPPKIFESLR